MVNKFSKSKIFFQGEMSNHFLLGLQFYLTDVFLYRKFSSYGWDTLEYFSHPLRLEPRLKLKVSIFN